MTGQVLQCIQEGRPLLLENLPEDIDAVLDPVIGKHITRRGKGLFLKIGDNEVEYDPNFRWLMLLLVRACITHIQGGFRARRHTRESESALQAILAH